MSAENVHSAGRIAADRFNELFPDLEKFYTDLHAHHELWMRETRTAKLAADRLRAPGYDVTTGESAKPASLACCAMAMGRR